MSYSAWRDLCDKVAALVTEGRLTEDLADDAYWRESWEWGDTPDRAVRGAVARS